MSLRAVSHDDDYAPDEFPAPRDMYDFEGQKVEGLLAKLTSVSGLEISDDIHRIDDTVRMLVTGRVTRVDHVVNAKTGRLERIETIQVSEVIQVPWDALSELME